jgi:hypothetical protein
MQTILATAKSLTEPISKFALLIILVCVFVPLSPKMPAAGLDPSWALALNQALAQGLAFGKDIIFTLGPYSSIYTKSYHPATDFMMIGGSFYLALSYWLALIFLMKTMKWRWIFVFSIFFLGMIYSRDSLLFSYPLLVGLISIKTAKQIEITNKFSCFFLAFLFAPFGLLTLVKGSLAILCLVSVLLCFSFFIAIKKLFLAILCLVSFIAALLLFWLGSGQALPNLPSYLVQTLSLAADFSEAMAISGNNEEIIVYLLSAFLILLALACQKQMAATSRFFLSGLFFVFLFMSFKAGFARHYGHAFIPATSILLAALLLVFIINRNIILPIIFLSSCSFAFIIGNYSKISLPDNFKSTYSQAWNGLKNRLKDKHWLIQNFELSLAYLHKQAPFPPLQGTTDIYSFEQTYLISSQNKWSPRPVFQSYSVFNSALAEKNRRHLLAENRPDNIIFRIEPIDNRIPSLEDGASWPTLMVNYQPSQAVNDFLFLKKKETGKTMSFITREDHVFGDFVTLPIHNQPLFAKLEIKPTLWGKLANFFLKPSELNINFVLKDGSKRQYRLIAKMAKSGFLMSPLIENTAEFALLYDKENYLDAKMVKSFSISTNQGKVAQWSKDYNVQFKRIEITSPG